MAMVDDSNSFLYRLCAVTFSNPSSSIATRTDRSGKVVSSSPTSSMSARDSTGDDSDGPLQELSELNLRAHTQSVGKTEYDPFQHLWANKHSKSNEQSRSTILMANHESNHHNFQNILFLHETMQLPPNLVPRATQVPVVTEVEINPSSTPDSTRATYHDNPLVASDNRKNLQPSAARLKDDHYNRNTDARIELERATFAGATDPTDAHAGSPPPQVTKLFVSNKTTPPESPDSLCPLNRPAVAIRPTSSRLLIPRITEKILHSDTRLVSSRRGEKEGKKTSQKRGTSTGRKEATEIAITRNGKSTARHLTKSKTSLSVHQSTCDRGNLEGFSGSSDRTFGFHGASLRANEAASQLPLEAKSVADFLREQLRSHSSAARSNCRQGNTFRNQNARQVSKRISSVDTTGIGQDESPFSSPCRPALGTPSLTKPDGTGVMAKGDTPSTYRRFCRRTGTSSSSLRMLVFVVWSLLTWTTTPAPNFWADLLATTRETMSLPEVSIRTPLAGKPNISEPVSSFIPGRNQWRLEGDAAFAGGHISPLLGSACPPKQDLELSSKQVQNTSGCIFHDTISRA
jgi:hypothetical protein